MCTDTETLEELLSAIPEAPSSADYRAIAKKLLKYIHAYVPPLGEGRSGERLKFLTEIARRDLSLARIIEGHLDAVQILHEAGRTIEKGALYAVWASGGGDKSLQISPDVSSPETIFLTGCKLFCSGADLVDRALVYVYPNEQLVEINIQTTKEHGHLTFDGKLWKSPAFSETHTWAVTFDQLPVTPDDYVGSRAWYFKRPGFCLGAFSPAACWAGGALAMLDSLRERPLTGGHAKAHLGAVAASACSMQLMLMWAAKEIDADPTNESGRIFPIALLVRHHIERNCTEILDRFGRTLGPRPYAFDTRTARRIAELNLYIRQCHAERDLEELGDYLQNHPEVSLDGRFS